MSPEWTLLAELSDARRERPMLGAGVRYQPAALKGWSFGAGAHRQKAEIGDGRINAYSLNTRYSF